MRKYIITFMILIGQLPCLAQQAVDLGLSVAWAIRFHIRFCFLVIIVSGCKVIHKLLYSCYLNLLFFVQKD